VSAMAEVRIEGHASQGARKLTEMERSLQEWDGQVQHLQPQVPQQVLRSHVNVKQMGSLKRKQGKGSSLTSHYKEEVKCWVENNAFFLSDGGGGSEKWELDKCQLRPPRSEKLDRFKLCMVGGNPSSGLKEVSLQAANAAEAQEWVRAILVSQKVAEATSELQAEHTRILKECTEAHTRAIQQLASTGTRVIQLFKESERKIRRDLEKDLEAAISMRDEALEQNEILRNEQLMLQEEVGRVEGAALTLSTQNLPEDIAQVQHLKDLRDQLKEENKELRLENKTLLNEVERLQDMGRKYQSAELRLDNLSRSYQSNQLPSSVLQQQSTNAELMEELTRTERKLRDQQKAFSSYAHHLENTIENCMSRLEVVDALLQDLRQREITSLSQNNALIEWAKRAAGYDEDKTSGRSSVGVPVALMEALQEQYDAQKERLAFLEESDRRVRADCLQTIMLLKSMQAKSRQRGSPFDYIEDGSRQPVIRSNP